MYDPYQHRFTIECGFVQGVLGKSSSYDGLFDQ